MDGNRVSQDLGHYFQVAEQPPSANV
jgi:hypothetical protein